MLIEKKVVKIRLDLTSAQAELIALQKELAQRGDNRNYLFIGDLNLKVYQHWFDNLQKDVRRAEYHNDYLEMDETHSYIYIILQRLEERLKEYEPIAKQLPKPKKKVLMEFL